MKILKMAAIGAAGVVAAASPAAAQYYPQTAYPQTAYPQQYGYPQGGSAGQVVGAIINAVTGGSYGQYPMGNYGYNQVSQRQAVQQCAIAAEQRIAASYSGVRRDAYGRPVTVDAYGRPIRTDAYGRQLDAYGRPVADPYGRPVVDTYGRPVVDAYGRPVAVGRDAYGRPLTSGTVQAGRVLGVTSVERRANGMLRVRGLATSGTNASYDAYGRPVYGANAQADLAFNCRVDLNGRVRDIDLSRNVSGYRR